jgi:hypothetical protein
LTFMRKAIWILKLSIYNLLIVSVVLYFGFWTGYRDRLVNAKTEQSARTRVEPTRHVDEATNWLLGTVGQNKLSSFINFDIPKSADTTRVCALGDSITQGDEVGLRHDYPSYLQRMFTANGFDNVQVLNFGNGWYGFSQIYVMWKNVAKRFDCDFVLLVPKPFWAARDTTFNHTGLKFPGYLHARLILDEESGLRLIAPLGATAVDRLRGYIRAIPHWTYLRYDRHPPNILYAMLPFGRTIPNPFYYYSKSAGDEAVELYQRVIADISGDGPTIIVLFNDRNPDFQKTLTPPREMDIATAVLDEESSFPYVASTGHPSSWGQELVAKSFYRLLTDSTDVDHKLVRIDDVLDSQFDNPEPLHAFERVLVNFRNERVGLFVDAASQRQYRLDEKSAVFRQRKVAALLYLSVPDGNIGDSCIVPLSDIPSAGSELKLVPQSTGKRPLSFGAIRQMQPQVAIYKVDFRNILNNRCKHFLPNAGGSYNVEDGALMLDDIRIGEVIGNKLEPEFRSLMKLRETGEHLASVHSLTSTEEMQIELQSEDGSRISRPLITISARFRSEALKVIHPPTTIIRKK